MQDPCAKCATVNSARKSKAAGLIGVSMPDLAWRSASPEPHAMFETTSVQSNAESGGILELYFGLEPHKSLCADLAQDRK